MKCKEHQKKQKLLDYCKLREQALPNKVRNSPFYYILEKIFLKRLEEKPDFLPMDGYVKKINLLKESDKEFYEEYFIPLALCEYVDVGLTLIDKNKENGKAYYWERIQLLGHCLPGLERTDLELLLSSHEFLMEELNKELKNEK